MNPELIKDLRFISNFCSVYSMGGPDKCFGQPVDNAEASGSWKRREENESSCSYSISVGSEEPKNARERSKSLSQLDPDMASGEVTRIRERLLR